MAKTELSEWKLSVIADLVFAVVPTDPKRAKTWEDVSVLAVGEYERDPSRWQAGDPNFELYEDNFIRKEYIQNRRHEIRNKLIQEKGVVLLWAPGRAYTGVWRDDTADAMQAYLEARRRNLGGQAEGYNSQVDAGSKLHGISLPIFEEAPRLVAGVRS